MLSYTYTYIRVAMANDAKMLSKSTNLGENFLEIILH